jgi:protein-L-isoaspartate(D-aspartate) O-methyltransferase
VRTGDGWLGAPDEAPFDRIEVTVGVSDLAPAWRLQLAPGGILVAPLWLRAGLQAAVAFVRSTGGDRLRSRQVEPCGFMRLRGPHAGPEAFVEVRPGLLTCVDDVATLDLALLRTLLEGPSTRHPAPQLSTTLSWFTRLALEEPGAIALSPVDLTDPGGALGGIFDPGPPAPGLALISPREGDLVVFGDPGAADRLRRCLDGPSVELSALRIEAIPADAVADPAASEPPRRGVWRIDRPAHRFLLEIEG